MVLFGNAFTKGDALSLTNVSIVSSVGEPAVQEPLRTLYDNIQAHAMDFHEMPQKLFQLNGPFEDANEITLWRNKWHKMPREAQERRLNVLAKNIAGWNCILYKMARFGPQYTNEARALQMEIFGRCQQDDLKDMWAVEDAEMRAEQEYAKMQKKKRRQQEMDSIWLGGGDEDDEDVKEDLEIAKQRGEIPRRPPVINMDLENQLRALSVRKKSIQNRPKRLPSIYGTQPPKPFALPAPAIHGLPPVAAPALPPEKKDMLLAVAAMKQRAEQVRKERQKTAVIDDELAALVNSGLSISEDGTGKVP